MSTPMQERQKNQEKLLKHADVRGSRSLVMSLSVLLSEALLAHDACVCLSSARAEPFHQSLSHPVRLIIIGSPKANARNGTCLSESRTETPLLRSPWAHNHVDPNAGAAKEPGEVAQTRRRPGQSIVGYEPFNRWLRASDRQSIVGYEPFSSCS